MSAERKIQLLDELPLEMEAPLEPFALKQQVAERLAAHRARRTGGAVTTTEQPSAAPRGRNSRIAAAVAERYAQSKSYRAFLAEEAERAVREAEETARQAEAAAEVAARNAQAVAQVQYDLLAELDGYAAEAAPAPALVETLAAEQTHQARTRAPETEVEQPRLNLPPERTFTAADLTVRLASELRRPEAPSAAHRTRHSSSAGPAHESIEEIAGVADPSETLFLDDEIAFRQAPVFEPVEAPVEIPANLIEFPRQLVASRRARPRLAEGPLREEAEHHHDPSQLRIFEVETEQISSEPAADSSAPEWTSILLDAHPRDRHTEQGAYTYEAMRASVEYSMADVAVDPSGAQHLHPSPETQHLYAAQLYVAPVELRVMAAAVDACAVLAGSMIFAGGFALTASHFLPDGLRLSLPMAATSAGGIIVLLALLYQWVFFTFSEATPGMRYARIGLCTFTDENPTRSAMRRRIFAYALSMGCFGLGLLWTFLDDDRLSWHDRISGMYQRSY